MAGSYSILPAHTGHTVHSNKFDAGGRINVADGGVSGNTAALCRSFGDNAKGGTFFLETFGCLMNDHDSEKVAGLLVIRAGTGRWRRRKRRG